LTSASKARDAYSFGAEDGPLDYYLIYGPDRKQVVEGYAYLTGATPSPAVGFGLPAVSHMLYLESQVRRSQTALRADKIPSDVLYLDIDYQDQGIGRSR